MRLSFLSVGLILALTACSAPPNTTQKHGTSTGVDVSTGAVSINDATPQTADSLEVPVAATGAHISGFITNDLAILFGDAPSTSKDFYIAPTFMEFISYDCQYCRSYIRTVRPWIVSTYVATHRLNIERWYVVQTPQGELTGRAAICAAEQKGFDAMDTYLLDHPSADEKAILKQSSAQKLSASAMKKCLHDPATLNPASGPDGMNGSRITRVPAFTFGSTWVGVETPERLKQIIDTELKKR